MPFVTVGIEHHRDKRVPACIVDLAGEDFEFEHQAVHQSLRSHTGAALNQRQQAGFVVFLAALIDRLDHTIGKDHQRIAGPQHGAAAQALLVVLSAQRGRIEASSENIDAGVVNAFKTVH